MTKPGLIYTLIASVILLILNITELDFDNASQNSYWWTAILTFIMLFSLVNLILGIRRSNQKQQRR